MAFDNAVFPLELSALGIQTAWSTTVVELGGGNEQRNINFGDARRHYDANTPTLTLAQYLQIEKHFNARRGRGRSFPLRDRSSFRAATEALGTAGGAASTMQLVVASGDASNAYAREVYLPESGTLHVYANAVEKTEGVDWSMAYTGATAGTLTWINSFSGQSITWSGDYYIPVRYDLDQLSGPELFIWTSGTTGLVQGPSIPLIEVRYANEF